MEASIEVTAQAFYDAHEASDQKLGKVRIVCSLGRGRGSLVLVSRC